MPGLGGAGSLPDPSTGRSRATLQVRPLAEREIDLSDTRARVAAVLELMTATLRIPLGMRDMDELSYQEIADELGKA